MHGMHGQKSNVDVTFDAFSVDRRLADLHLGHHRAQVPAEGGLRSGLVPIVLGPGFPPAVQIIDQDARAGLSSSSRRPQMNPEQ